MVKESVETMNKYTLAKQKTLAELCVKHEDRIKELERRVFNANYETGYDDGYSKGIKYGIEVSITKLRDMHGDY